MNGGVLNVGAYNLTLGSVTLAGGTINATSGGISSSSSYQLQSGTVSSSLRGTGGLIKTTPGTVVLNSASTYSGGTQVRGGKLVVNNSTGSGTGSGTVSISDGGLVMGIGTISGIVTNGPGGSISAGNEIGVLNLGSTLWFGGATNRWDIANATGTAGTGWDLLNISGTLTLSASALDQAIIDVTSFTLAGVRGQTANFDPTQNYLWTIVQTSGGIFFSPGNNASTVFDLLTGNFSNTHDGGSFAISLSADGRQLNLSYTYIAVPEPGMLSLLGIGLFGLIYIKRFKRNWGPQR
jgi:autotransporter-associated beta strand protein